MWYNLTIKPKGKPLVYIQFIEIVNDTITLLIFSDNYLNSWLQLDARKLEILENYIREKDTFEIMYSWQDMNYSGQLITINRYMVIEVSPQKPEGFTVNIGNN